MSLNKGAKAKSTKGFAENIETEMDAGYPQNESEAIAYSEAGEHRPNKQSNDSISKSGSMRHPKGLSYRG